MNAFHAYQKIERRIVELELLTRGSTVVDKEVGRVVKDRKDEYYVIETYRTYASELNACQDQSAFPRGQPRASILSLSFCLAAS